MFKYSLKFMLFIFIVLMLLPLVASAKHAVDLNLVVQMKGRGGFEYPPPKLAHLLPDGAGGCFVTDLVDPKTGWTIGRGYDCILGNPVPIDINCPQGGFTIETAYMLDFTGQGTIVTINNVTVRPTGDIYPEETWISHVVGDFPAEQTIYSGSRRFHKTIVFPIR